MGFKVIDYINRKKVGMGMLLGGIIAPTLVNKAKEKDVVYHVGNVLASDIFYHADQGSVG